jgi:hypothetical protein
VSDVQIVVPPSGPIELHYPNGWLFQLHGVRLGDRCSSRDRASLEVIVRDLNDETLASIRFLRDNFSDEIQLVHETH